MNIQEKIFELLSTYKGEDVDLCFAIVQALKQSEDVGNDLQFFFDNVGFVETNETLEIPSIFSKYELMRLDKIYSEYIKGFLNFHIKKAHNNQVKISDFYMELWKGMSDTSVFEDDNAKAFALLCMAQNMLLPYFELQIPITMDTSRFKEIFTKNYESVKKIIHIANLGLVQKTEVCSLFLYEILKNDDFEEQSVLMSIAFDAWYKNKTKDVELKKIQEDNS